VHIVNSPYPGTQAVLRAVDLLKAFSPSRPERSLTDLSATVGLNRTTTYRLLSALQSEGLVERQGAEYRLGPELMALGARAAGSSLLLAAVRPELADLAAATGETATVEVLVGRDTLIIDEAVGRHRLTIIPSLGTRWPAHTTSTGKVLLAASPEDAVAAFLAEPLERLTPKTTVDRATLRRELSRVRDRGVATSLEEVELGFVAVGVPIRGPGGAVVAALSVGGPRGRFAPPRIKLLARQLRVAADRIASRLGATPGDPAPSPRLRTAPPRPARRTRLGQRPRR